MLGHSVSYYLPSFWATTPLYAEKIIPLLDTYLSVASPRADKLALAYYDVVNKYLNTEDMTDDSIRAFIEDSGYGYLMNLLDNSSKSLRKLLILLPVIAYLKDSLLGLHVVFSLLQTEENSLRIEEWWESKVVGPEDTFELDCELDVNNIGDNFLVNFDVFIKKYVHPTLSALKTMYTIKGEHTLLPVVTIFHTLDLKNSYNMDD